MKKLKRFASLLLALLLTFSVPTACSAAGEENSRIRLSWDGKEVVVQMLNNDAADDLLSKLPLTVSFGDYRERQKTAEVPLDVGTAPGECECLAGDMNYYAPWNDINFFYKDFGYADDLTPLGKVESGIEYLRELDNGSPVRIELAESASAPAAVPSADPQGHATHAEMEAMLHRWLIGNEAEGNTPETPDAPAENRVLVAYFSRTGTTQGMAEMIAGRTNGTLFEIVPETPYSEVYQETVSRHQEERRTDARPAIASQVEGMEGYTIIFLGFPLWSADAPMIIRTFMESYDLSGKTVIPFATSGGSGMSAAQSTVETFCPDSNVLNGLCISGGRMESRVSSWLEGLDLPQ